MDISPNLCCLPRFPLSLILSFIQQQPNINLSSNSTEYDTPVLPHNRDALSFLLTTKRLAYAILPLFRVPKHACLPYQCQTRDGYWIKVVEKYRFRALPIQDPLTLLDRLNTRRLRGRKLLRKQQLEKEKHSLQRYEGVGKEDGIGAPFNHHSLRSNYATAQDKSNELCYQFGRAIQELAHEEWIMMEIDHASGLPDFSRNGNKKKWRTWPSHLELLRVLENKDSRKLQEQSKVSLSQTQQRATPSLFRFSASSDEARKDEKESVMRKISNDFFDGQFFGNGVSLLASYPRSGNTLLRTLLERSTLIVTGSDTHPNRTLSRSLAIEHDLVGEGLVGSNNQTNQNSKSFLDMQNVYQCADDPEVHIVKTHFPERKGWKPVKANSVLLLVRNPYDAIDSYWNLCCTNTHTQTLHESVYTKYAQKFEGLARHEIKTWCDFHYYWIDICKKEGVPLLVVRYEDLLLNTEAEMFRLMKFLISQHSQVWGSQSMSFWKWRIRHAIEQSLKSKPCTNENGQTTNTSNLGSYRPRSSDGGLRSIGKSIRKSRYSQSVLRHMHQVAVSLELSRHQNSNKQYPTAPERKFRTLLQEFGYDIYGQQFPDNFKQPPAMACYGPVKGNGTVVINNTSEIRDKDDQFGRAMTLWRRGETDADTKPFPTIPI